jgi:hypothetical protein
MSPTETYFHVLTLLSRTSLIDVTHEGVALCALARLIRAVHTRRATLASTVPR